MKVIDAIRHTKAKELYVAVAFMVNRPADRPWVMSPRKKDGLTIADVEECMYNKVGVWSCCREKTASSVWFFLSDKRRR